jgi:uncharacterized membrane protein YkvA (DUF1232 family)
MLNALQGQLKLMAADPNDPFTGIIRKMVGPREAVHYERSLRALILAMPAMIGQIRSWVNESKLPSPLKRMPAFIMVYLYSPEDLLPESSMGFFGYLDDAYLVAQVYHRTMLEADSFGIKHFVKDKTLTHDVQNWLKMVKQLLPAEAAAMDRMLEEVPLRIDGNFSKLLSKAAKDGRTAGCGKNNTASGRRSR